MKKAFKLASRALFGMAKCLYLFQIDQFSQKFQFFAEFSDGDMYNQRYMHVTTRLILPELICLECLSSPKNINFFYTNFQTVTCIYNHRYMSPRAKLSWQKLTHWKNRLKHSSLEDITWHSNTISYGSVLILWFLLKLGQMVICPVRRTYNHVWIFLC